MAKAFLRPSLEKDNTWPFQVFKLERLLIHPLQGIDGPYSIPLGLFPFPLYFLKL